MPDAPGAAAARTCSFCGTEERMVSRLFVGRGCLVCDQCIDLCSDIIAEEVEQTPDPSTEASSGPPTAAGLSCSSCGADGATVAKLIAGPESRFICGGCVDRFAAELPPDRPRWKRPPWMRAIEVVLRLVFLPLWWLRRLAVFVAQSDPPSR